MQDKVVVVTGASSGIGAALAEIVGGSGARPVLAARREYAPIRSAYSAAKHALNALTANLRMELRSTHPGIHVSSVHPGVVATDFGLSARHGGVDSRTLSFGQSAEEVARVIADVIERPRADVYTRPGARERVAAYYAAEDMAEAEARLS